MDRDARWLHHVEMRIGCVVVLVIVSVALPRVADAQETSAIERDAAARAAFERAQSFHDFESFEIEPGTSSTFQSYMDSVMASIRDGSRRAQLAIARYSRVLTFRSPTWSVAALVEQGRIYETLVRGVRDVPMPIRIAPELIPRVQRVLLDQVAPAECFAVSQYVEAVRVARAAKLDTVASRTARDRLRGYADRRITQCIDRERARVGSIAPYRPGELDDRAPGVRQNRAAPQPR